MDTTMFFKKKAVQFTIVDKPKYPKANDTTPEETHILHPDSVKAIADHGKTLVKHVALAAIGVYAAVKAIDTVSQIAVKKTKSADQD
uniref:Uncharacterized protein n=4 Tax=Rimavirus rima TaxID=2560784 RepID=A0A8F3E9G0_9CAUD